MVMKRSFSQKRIGLHELPRIDNRITFLYLDHSKINCLDSAVTVFNAVGTTRIPAALIGVLFLGPGTEITHRAMQLLGDVGASVVWVGEQGVRNYAHARPLTRTSRLIEKQARLVSNTRSRLAVARNMYQMRFPSEDVSSFTMQQLRGREGARVRSIYRNLSRKYAVPWNGRDYDVNNFEDGTPINKALSAGNVCLYGLVHSVIMALGLSPALGFVHTGHDLSFVYDIADLYKAETSMPLAFSLVAEMKKNENSDDDVACLMRIRMRDCFAAGKLLRRVVKDIQVLLNVPFEQQVFADVLQLWDGDETVISAGINYSRE